ncbi:DUF349 domain-containing protein [Promicromonospora thailandica]|uniref:DUF349 domain-containing protein n=1 Tax=Promicromonospora thailandica TaxID=765201 RepID=A0A9X2GAW2_9MICO|nr:DUF349 domain-containing protein [Promicromonospora thailandica]MCP2265826.1 protein of unknown function (DUF349) [Promicromonospora thailandica]BFF21855.1 hypothetical protein GCM10025730_53760 [Promicromonospora thailandica]
MSEPTSRSSEPVQQDVPAEPVAETPTAADAPAEAVSAADSAEEAPAADAAPEAAESGTAVDATPEAAEEAPAEEVPAEEAAAEEAPAAETADAPAEVAAEPEAEAAATEEPTATEAPAEEAAAAETATATEAPAEQPVAEDAPGPAEASEPPAATDDAPAEAPAAETPAAETSEQADAPADAPAAQAPEPTPKPSAIPSPAALARPRPRKPGTPAAPAAQATPAAAPAPVVPAAADAVAHAEAEKFGRVDDEGTVYVREAAGERVVGQFPGVSTPEALALYVRRYLDLNAKVGLFEARLESADLSVREIDQTLQKLGEETAEPAAVGDLDGLRARVEALRGRAAERRAALEAARAAAKAEAVAARTAIVEAAEKIAATDPNKMQWRPAGEELRSLLDRWKEAQRSGPRIDRPTEESLWKRFSHARTAFDRERRHFFADLEQRNSAAKIEKEKLVSEAEALSTSTDWGYTAGAYRDLMARWKAAGRASRKDDDALWARFRAAQDRFFQARDAENAVIDAEYGENLKVKEELLVEAEALVPVKDLNKAKAALRNIQERWEEAGKVPRGDIQRVEGRLRAVETAIRDADQAQWRRTNPETRARAEGAAAQLEAAIAGLEADLAAAQAKGDKRKVAELEAAVTARRSWLEQVVKAAEDSRG